MSHGRTVTAHRGRPTSLPCMRGPCRTVHGWTMTGRRNRSTRLPCTCACAGPTGRAAAPIGETSPRVVDLRWIQRRARSPAGHDFRKLVRVPARFSAPAWPPHRQPAETCPDGTTGSEVEPRIDGAPATSGDVSGRPASRVLATRRRRVRPARESRTRPRARPAREGKQGRSGTTPPVVRGDLPDWSARSAIIGRLAGDR